jgi:hypothetical protein
MSIEKRIPTCDTIQALGKELRIVACSKTQAPENELYLTYAVNYVSSTKQFVAS